MNKAIRALVQYVEDREILPELRQAEAALGPQRLRVAAIKILGWLKSQARFLKFRPLRLESAYPWTHDVTTLVEQCSVLSEVVEIGPGVVDYRASLSDNEKRKIVEFVDQGYTPRLMR